MYNEADLEEIQRLIFNEGSEIEDADQILEDDDSDADPDFNISSDHNSDSEQDESNQQVNNDNYYLGKDGACKWRQTPPSQRVRRRSHNIIRKLPGVIGRARECKSIIECWELFFSHDIMDSIVTYTNIFIAEIAQNYSDPHDCKPTKLSEIKALFGILYAMGVHKGGRLNISEFWATDGSGHERIIASMSQRRFSFLLRCLRFDDKGTRNQRKETDKLAAVRELMEIFNKNCKTHYCVGHYLTLDEMLLAFHGRCGFRMHIPSKPAKYGIKVFSLVDARIFYTYNLEIYCGKQPVGPYEKLSFKPEDVVERMCLPVAGSGRNLTIDNWFNSFPLVERMLKEHKITIVGTMKKNKREIPPSFINGKRPVYDSKFGFKDNTTLVSYIPKKGKTVLLVSSMHDDDEIDDSSGDKKKPAIITFYNMTKTGVDCVDQQISLYNVARNTKRWPMVIFYSLLNISTINSFIIYKSNNQNDSIKSRRTFIHAMILSLTQENIRERIYSAHVPKMIKQIGKNILKIEDEQAMSTQQKLERSKRGRCAWCRDRKSRYQCSTCSTCICLEHSNFVCANCISQ